MQIPGFVPIMMVARVHKTVADISHLFLTEQDIHENPGSSIETERPLLPQVLAAERLDAVADFARRLDEDLSRRLKQIDAAASAFQELELKQPRDRRYSALQEAANDARESLESLLLFARVRPPARREFRVSDLIRVVLHSAQGEFHSRGITAHWHESERGLTLFADAALMEQVLFQILKNAWESISQGPGLIHLEARAEGDECVIDIADTGPGMDSEALKRAFEPYFTTKKNHAGLGLARAHGIITAHGGRITATSEPGEGTVITIGLRNG